MLLPENVCDLVEIKSIDIIGQWYSNVRKYRRIKKYSMSEIFSENDTLKGMKVTRHQNLRSIGIVYRESIILTHI